MATASQALFFVGTIGVILAFAAHVGHAVLLANGRRALAVLVPAAAPQPAWAGVVTGSFATARAARSTTGTESAAPTPLGRAAVALTLFGWAALGGAMLTRAILVGRGPWGNLYEFSVAFAFMMLAGYLVLGRRYPIRSIGFIPVGVAAGLLLYAASLPSDIKPLVPALNNAPLLTIHVGMATLSYGIFATSFAAGVGYLIQGQRDRFAWLPSHRTLDEVAYRAVIVGFPIFATMIILGSWWASIAWSRYWGWDPKETSALVTWLVYAVYLHARNQRRWAGRPAALLLVVGFAMVLVTYSGSLWFSGLHSYSGL
ncbi:MAG TPA: cytochrome c biogenesis protein CcsA [Candidatus Limnocylindrales bacterium]|nr:cytochrome c biogenesis protein CcsA [Candidatus Limnocylindrales bacterium]